MASLTLTSVVSSAKTEVGVKEVPLGSNKTKYGAWYPMNGQAWCAMFVSWLFRNALGLIHGKFARTDTKAKDLNAKKLFTRGASGAAAGDILFFALYGSNYQGRFLGIHHVGLCIGKLADGRLIVIEGNTSDMVKIMYRHPSSVAGYFRPKYTSAAAAPAPKPATPAPATSTRGIVTAKSGLIVRAGQGTNYKRLGALKLNTHVDIVSSNGGWHKIKFGNGYGYVSASWVAKIASTPKPAAPKSKTKTGVVTAKSGLVVRAGRGTNYKRLGALPKGTKITILGTTGGWHQINYQGKTGYVSATWVK